MQREVDSQRKIEKAIQQEYPNFRVCYYPAWGLYGAHLCYDDVGEMHEDRGQCLLAAWKILIQGLER